MRQLTLFLFSISLVIAANVRSAEKDVNNDAEWVKEAERIARQFTHALKPRLVAAIQAGGFEHAITVCAETAPAIAERLSADSGWTVKRVSLKPRNSAQASPDDFEREVLKAFERRSADGEAPASLDYTAVVGGRLRYMKAQSVGPLCLNCHGHSISRDVSERIKQYYPDDMATGYSQGQIRGAVSLSKPL